tara:strand:- start:932 stop:1621 length:690 start_codon:yes stop_codon:yes gene_type:complete
MSDHTQNNLGKIKFYSESKIEIGDILKIDVFTDIPEASIPYNKTSSFNQVNSIDILLLEGYLVNQDYDLNFPVIGKINVINLSERELSKKITELLIKEGHLANPFVKVKKLNSKFTVIGEVKNPGTFSFYNQLNIFQALGYAGDLLITAKRKDIKLIRQEKGLIKTYTFSLNNSKLLYEPFYNIKNNDIIIVDPNYSKIKSAGFIGSPSSIASISSLLLSITLLIINNN